MKLEASIRRGAALVPLQSTPARTNPRRFFHSPQCHVHLATAQAVAALALEQKRAGWARESGAWGRNRSGGVRRLLQHEGRGQGRRNRGDFEARKAVERQRGGRERATGGDGFSDRW